MRENWVLRVANGRAEHICEQHEHQCGGDTVVDPKLKKIGDKGFIGRTGLSAMCSQSA
jgi:hypothetical protein